MHLTAPSNWSRSIGTGGRDPSERVVTIAGMRRFGIIVVRDASIALETSTSFGGEWSHRVMMDFVEGNLGATEFGRHRLGRRDTSGH